jgi:hypothetical protein
MTAVAIALAALGAAAFGHGVRAFARNVRDTGTSGGQPGTGVAALLLGAAAGASGPLHPAWALLLVPFLFVALGLVTSALGGYLGRR